MAQTKATIRHNKRNHVIKLDRQSKAIELYCQGYGPVEIGRQLKLSRVTIWKYIQDAFKIYSERFAEGIEPYIYQEWARLDVREQELWAIYRDLRGEGKDRVAAVEMTRLFAEMNHLSSLRIQLMNKIDPGTDESVDIDVTLVIVRDRKELPAVMEAIEFAKRVHHDNSRPAITTIEAEQSE